MWKIYAEKWLYVYLINFAVESATRDLVGTEGDEKTVQEVHGLPKPHSDVSPLGALKPTNMRRWAPNL